MIGFTIGVAVASVRLVFLAFRIALVATRAVARAISSGALWIVERILDARDRRRVRV